MNRLEGKSGKRKTLCSPLNPDEGAKAVAFLASNDSGMMAGSVIHFDQSVWGGYSFAPPTPETPLAPL